MPTYTWTVTSNYYYDATLTTDLLKNYLDDWLDSSGRDNHFYRLSNMGNLSVWPGEKQDSITSHYEVEGDDEPTPSGRTASITDGSPSSCATTGKPSAATGSKNGSAEFTLKKRKNVA